VTTAPALPDLCPICGTDLEQGKLGGAWFTWVPEERAFRRTMLGRMNFPSKRFGRSEWPFWSAKGSACRHCGLVIVPMVRGKRGDKRMS